MALESQAIALGEVSGFFDAPHIPEDFDGNLEVKKTYEYSRFIGELQVDVLGNGKFSRITHYGNDKIFRTSKAFKIAKVLKDRVREMRRLIA